MLAGDSALPHRAEPFGATVHRTPAGRLAVWLLAGIMLVLLVLPLLTLALRTVVGSSTETQLAARPVLDALALSLNTTALSVLVMLALGTPLAYILGRVEFPLKRIVNTLIELPIVLPPVVAGLALLMTFGRRGLLGGPLALAGISLPFSTTAVVLAQVFVAAPFYIRTAQLRFASIPVELEEAAAIDGANGWQMFHHVILPLSLPGLLAGLIMGWARALGEFGATILFAGNIQGRTQTMPLLVYGALERNLHAALLAALILIGLALAALVTANLLTRSYKTENDPLRG